MDRIHCWYKNPDVYRAVFDSIKRVSHFDYATYMKGINANINWIDSELSKTFTFVDSQVQPMHESINGTMTLMMNHYFFRSHYCLLGLIGKVNSPNPFSFII